MAGRIGCLAVTTLLNRGAQALLDGAAVSSLNLPPYILGCVVMLQIAPSWISLTLGPLSSFSSKIKVVWRFGSLRHSLRMFEG